MQKRFFGDTKECWGVIRDRPWDAAGYFDTEAEALAKAARVGPGYAVRYGQHRVGTFGFMVMPRLAELKRSMSDEHAPSEAAKSKRQIVGDRQDTVPGAQDELLALLRSSGSEHREHRRPNRISRSDRKKR